MKHELLTKGTNTDINPEHQAWKKIQYKRKRNIKKACTKHRSLLKQNIDIDQFMYDREHNLLYCRIGKVLENKEYI